MVTIHPLILKKLDSVTEYKISLAKQLTRGGVSNYHGVLKNWVKVGDSVFKQKNSNHFIVKRKGDSDLTVTFFK